MTAAKIMDIIARLPGCDGQAAHAVSAYSQVKMEDAPQLLKIRKSECPDIWIRLPRHNWPKSWSSLEDPVVPLERNLYGHPLVPVSNLVDDRSGKPVETQANKIPKTIKKETTIERGNPLCSDDSEIPEWLQEFRENLVDDEIPLQGGSHASSSHEASLEPTTKRREDLGKHNVHTHFPEDRNCEICQRTKITRAPCRRRNGGAVPRAVNFGDLITADHKVLSDNSESRNNHRYAVVVQDLATQWIQAYPCKNKTSQETQRRLQKFLEPERTKSHLH